MGNRRVALPGVLVVVAGALFLTTTITAQGQTPSRGSWTPAKTADGQPDLQGMWLGYDQTPFEAGEDRERTDNDDDPVRGKTQNVGPGYSRDWTALTRPPATARRSMVIDPPDGRVPLRESAITLRDYDSIHMDDSWVHQSGWERCITRGVPGGFFPAAYNAAFQIVQGQGYVAIIYEMVHEARIIPLDGRPHLPSTVRHWNGDSRGRWEGNTLVVDVTNYNDKGNIATSRNSGRIAGVRQSDAAHVVERFTRVSEHQIDYQVTIDDPKVYTRPWTVAMPLMRDDTYQIYEYACHEGNEAMKSILRGGRVKDKAVVTATSK